MTAISMQYNIGSVDVHAHNPTDLKTRSYCSNQYGPACENLGIHGKERERSKEVGV